MARHSHQSERVRGYSAASRDRFALIRIWQRCGIVDTLSATKIPVAFRCSRITPMLIGLLVAALACVQTNAVGQEAAAKKGDPLSIEILDVQLVNMTGLSSIQGQFSLKLKVKNESTEPLELKISNFKFECAGKVYPCNSAVRNPLLASSRKLMPGDEAEGLMGLNLNYTASDEPQMILLCDIEGSNRVQISVNTAISKLTKLSTRLIGPEKCLAVVEIRRAVDKLSIGTLTSEFQRLQQLGIQRVVLDVKPTIRGQSPSYSARMAISGWLGSVKKGYSPRRYSFGGTPVKSSVQFNDFHVSGMGKNDPSGFSAGGANIYQETLDQAIAFALRSEYERMPLESAMVDMQNDEPGIRRIAIEANIDRLTEAQLKVILSDAKSQSAAHQALIAANLCRVSYPTAVATLETLVRDTNSEVSQAALESLVNSVSPNAVQALKQFWFESDGNTALRQDIVTAIMKARDYRYADLLEDYAKNLILSSVERASQKTESSNTSAIDTSSSVAPRPAFHPSLQARNLKGVLDFLKVQDNNGAILTAKSQLLKIVDPGFQDVVLEFLTSSGADSEVNTIARAYIKSRLAKPPPREDGLTEGQLQAIQNKYGPEGGLQSKRITKTLLNTIRRFPDSAYTNHLVELASLDDSDNSDAPPGSQNAKPRADGISSTLRRNAFQVATLCATDQQLEMLIAKFNSLDRYGKDHLLKQMSALGHEKLLPLAKKCLDQDESTRTMAISVLAQNKSVEALTVLIDRLEEVIDQAEQKAARLEQDSAKESETDIKGKSGQKQLAASARFELSAEPRRLVEKLINSLRLSKLPAARRALNRCERSSVIKLNELALKSAELALRSDPNLSALASAARLRRAEKYDLAKSAYDAILDSDPFCSSAYSSRSSLYLRTGEPELAMKDLKQALELEPEDVLIESLIALAEVRLGRPKEGIAQMEGIVKSIPDLPTTVRRDALYNLACTYGRAIEVEKDDAVRKKYVARAMQVFHDCIHREGGFDDPLHVKNDPDMNVFRSHPDWADLMAKIEQNEEESRGKLR